MSDVGREEAQKAKVGVPGQAVAHCMLPISSLQLAVPILSSPAHCFPPELLLTTERVAKSCLCGHWRLGAALCPAEWESALLLGMSEVHSVIRALKKPNGPHSSKILGYFSILYSQL